MELLQKKRNATGRRVKTATGTDDGKKYEYLITLATLLTMQLKDYNENVTLTSSLN